MLVQYTLWTRRDKAYAGKMTLVPETEEEAKSLRLFKTHAGIDQSGRKLNVVFRWKDDPKLLQEVRHDG
jgi:hypothetical protein